jgi:tRNA (guanine-N7-)-methyltransferase
VSGPVEPALRGVAAEPVAQGPSADPRVETEALRRDGLAAWLGPPPRVLEIGFGRGELLLASAADQPERSFLGVEVSRKRVEKMARRVVRAELPNLRLVRGRAEDVLEQALSDASFALCWLHCPDPWPKKRHHRRRFFQAGSVAQLARVLEPGARLLASTDDLEYAHWIARVMSAAPEFENLCAPEPWSLRPPAERRATAYEAEWLAEGRSLAYFHYRRR